MQGIQLGVLSGLIEVPSPGVATQTRGYPAAEQVVEPDLESPEEAFRVLGEVVWRLLRRSGVQASCLDDAVQDVFVVVVRRWADFRCDSTRKTWVLGIAAHVAANQRRRQRRTEESCDPTLELPMPFSPLASQRMGRSPQDELAIKQAGQLVDSILKQLSDSERSLFILVDMEGFQVPEVAPALELSSRQAHTILERVRRRFETEIARHLRGTP